MQQFTEPRDRLLLGPGPSNVNPRVIRAMTLPLMGYLDPTFLKVLDEVVELLRQVFRTSNEFTLALSGTGTSGMEAALVNLLEPGDTAVICANGLFGNRMADIASRCGAKVITVSAEWGQTLDPLEVEQALKDAGQVKLLAVVHVETSTGVVQPLAPLAELAHNHNSLFLVDAVTSLGGVDLRVDEWGIDICYSATQKCIGSPPGLSPITLSPRAVEVLRQRQSPAQSFYLDLLLLERYWLTDRVYHHTASMSMIYALREALIAVMEEGLEARFDRHRRNADALKAGLAALGLPALAPQGVQAAPLTAAVIPQGIDEARVRRSLLVEYGIDIGGGFGPLAGKVWRIGLMGESSQSSHVLTLLHALEVLLSREGYEIASGSGVTAAHQSLVTG
jgi:alanine-glyoxylate transaminase/serine-glyoxylate transaminase/serine-pyruvate transaminase